VSLESESPKKIERGLSGSGGFDADHCIYKGTSQHRFTRRHTKGLSRKPRSIQVIGVLFNLKLSTLNLQLSTWNLQHGRRAVIPFIN